MAENGVRVPARSINKSRKVSAFEVELNSEQQCRHRIATAKEDLDLLIQQLDSKIKQRIQTSEGKFLCAFKIHLQKITKQLKTIKEQNLLYEKKFESDRIIDSLKKQCIFFRQEAMRLQNQLEDALSDVNVYKRRSEILQAELIRTNQTVKKFMSLNKNLQTERASLIKQRKTICKNQAGPLQQLNKFDQKQSAERPETSEKDGKNLETRGLNRSASKLITTDIVQLLEGEIIYPLHQEEKGENWDKYNVFLTQKPYLEPSSSKICKQSAKIRNKTHSTFQTDAKISGNPKYDTIRTHSKDTRQQKYEQSIGLNGEAVDQSNAFRNFLYSLDRARQALSLKEASPALASRTVNQLIFDDKDILQLLIKIFPNLSILYKSENVFGTRFVARPKDKNKSLAYLSTQLMKNINKIKSRRVKTQMQSARVIAEEQTKKPLAEAKTHRSRNPKNFNKNYSTMQAKHLEKMNATFKKKFRSSKTILAASGAAHSARQGSIF